MRVAQDKRLDKGNMVEKLRLGLHTLFSLSTSLQTAATKIVQ